MSNTELIKEARKYENDPLGFAYVKRLADALEAAEKERDHFREGVRALSAQLIETGQELSAAQTLISRAESLYRAEHEPTEPTAKRMHLILSGSVSA